MTLEIEDKKAETGIKLNNVLTGVSTVVICGLLAWVGTSLENIKSRIGDINILVARNSVEIENLKWRLNNLKIPPAEVQKHINDDKIHGPHN